MAAYRGQSGIEQTFCGMNNLDFLRWTLVFHWTDQNASHVAVSSAPGSPSAFFEGVSRKLPQRADKMFQWTVSKRVSVKLLFVSAYTGLGPGPLDRTAWLKTCGTD